jgi:hypothetical protein
MVRFMNKRQLLQGVLKNWVILAIGLTVSLTHQVTAASLPVMIKHPWAGFFSGYERRGFEFGIDGEGQCEIYLIASKTKQRIGRSRIIDIQAEVVIEDDQGRLTTKKLKKDSFSTDLKPGLDHEEVSFTAISVGDAKLEVTVKYERNRIILDGRILDRGSLKTGKIYLGFCVKVPAMYGKSTYAKADKKKLKGVMRGDRIRITRAVDKKRVSLKSYEVVDLQDKKIALGGVTEVKVDMDSQEGNHFVFTTLDGKGVIELTHKTPHLKAAMWKGYQVKWMREFTGVSAKDGDKHKTPTGISPLVIEMK